MSHDGGLQRVVTFKLDEETARLLESVPNRSEFIREAIAAQLKVPCPACNGSGMVTPAAALELAGLLNSHRSAVCAACGTAIFSVDCAERSEGTDAFLPCTGGNPRRCRHCAGL